MSDPDSFTEREHPIGLFDELICRGAGTVHLGSGPNPRLVVVGEPSLIERVVVRYHGTRLVVSFRVGPDPARFLGLRSDMVRTIVITDAVSRVALQGAANLVFGDGPSQPFTEDSLKLVTSGTGRISGDVSLQELSVRIRGMGGVSIAGDVASLDARLPGMGNLDCLDLVCDRAMVNISGVASGRLMVLDRLQATISGAGRLQYRGTALVTARGANHQRIERIA